MDSTFRAMLPQDTEESRAAMKSFLEAATERGLKDWRLTANEPPEEFAGQRGVSYDIACEFDDGKAAASLAGSQRPSAKQKVARVDRFASLCVAKLGKFA